MDINQQLIGAAQQGNLPKVKELVEEHGADIHADNDYALCWTSLNGHLSVVKYLIENGANIHACDDLALRWASYHGHLSVVKYLVEHGADIHADDDRALRWASENGYYDMLLYLFSQAKPDKPKALEWHKKLLAQIKRNQQALQAMPGLVDWLRRSGIGK